jgi:sugar lactone lactonase YvrE
MRRRLMRVDTLFDGGILFEAPRWHAGAWWVSDILGGRVLELTETGALASEIVMDTRPAGLGWLPDGTLLVVSSDDRRLLRRTLSGGLSVHAELAEVCGGPANELVLDRWGRAYVGELGFDVFASAPASTANLLRVDPDGVVSIVADELLFPNGSAITPDGGTLLICESFGGRIAAFSILDDGSLADRRAWGVMGAAVDPSADDWGPLLARQFAPDGMTLDAEGHVWVCDPANARCARLAPGGRVVAELAMPDGLTAFGCALGSADGRTLLVTAAPHEPRGRPDSVVLTARVAVPGV